jgi:exopolysaccharide production protein ExoQ
MPGFGEMPAGERKSVSRPGGADEAVFEQLPVIDADGAFALGLFAPMLFIVEFGSYGALVFSLVAIGFGYRYRRSLGEILRRYWFVFAFPAFALFSVIWSPVASDSLKHALEYLLTVFAGVLLVSSRNERSVMFAIFAAFAFYVAVSLVSGHSVAVGNQGTTALSGLAASKNEEADIAGTGLIVSIFILVTGLRRGSIAQGLVAFAACLVQAYAMVAADSAGALAGSLFAGLVFALLLLMRGLGQTVRATVVGLFGLLGTTMTLVFLIFTSDVLDWLAGEFHKDLTLTGRTYLWARARDILGNFPIGGMGWDAFWQHGNLDAEGLWQFAGIANREGFNFHSTVYDVLVQLGWVGLALFGSMIAIALLMLGKRYVQRPTPLACFWVTLAGYTLIRMPVESIGLNAYYYSTVLLFGMVTWACGGDRLGTPVAAWLRIMPASSGAAAR